MKVRRIDKGLPLPQPEEGAACFDLICREDKIIAGKALGLIPVNLVVQIPDGYALLIFARSSTPIRKGLLLANGVGVADPFFSRNDDELIVELLNTTDKEILVKRGDELAQAMLVKHESIVWEEVDEMPVRGGGYRV